MRAVLLFVSLSLLIIQPASAVSDKDRKAIIAQLEPLFKQSSEAASLSFSIGLADGDGGFGVTVGPPAAKADTGSRYPMGSVTKTWTVVAAMRLAEKGALDLDAPIHTVLDPWLTRTNGTTLAALWSDAGAGGNASSA